MASLPAVLPPLTTAEYKEIYELIFNRYYGRESTHECMLKCLSHIKTSNQTGLHVLLVGPGSGEVELNVLKDCRIAHLTAVEPSSEMADALEPNLRSSSDFIGAWNIHRTKIESYLMDKNNNDGPFDIILAIDSLYYVSSRGDVLRQLRSLLRPTIGRLIAVHVGDEWGTLARIYTPYSPHVVGASDIDRDLRDANILFDRYSNETTFDLMDVKGNDKLEWAIASFFLGFNTASSDNSLTADIITALLNMAQITNENRLLMPLSEDVFVIQPVN